MHKTFALLAATAAVGLASAAYAAEESAKAESKIEYDKDGGYESSASTTQKTAQGTAKKSETKVDVDVDADGHVTKTVKTKAVADPKGLMNKQKRVTESTVEEKDRGGYEKTTKDKQTNADGTNVTTKSEMDVKVDAEGNVKESMKEEKVVDPKGLMNKTKEVVETETINGKVIEQKVIKK